MGLPDFVVITFGLAVGSFLNVCIYRLPLRRSVVFQRSHCRHCSVPLKPWDNIPLLSYLLLRGKCRNCGIPISWVYPLVEALTAVLFYLLFLKYQLGSPFFVNLAFLSMLVVLIFVDLLERILPNVITLGGLVVGFVVSPLQSREFLGSDPFLAWMGGNWSSYAQSLLGVLVGGGVLWAVAMIYRKVRKVEGMGLGDIKMMAMIGAFLGWQQTWLTIFLGSLTGALVGSVYIYVLKKGRRYELPFGSFLGIGAIVATLWGWDLVGWYLSLL